MRDDRGHLRMTKPPVRKWQFLDSRTTQIFGQSLHGIGRSLKRLLDAGAPQDRCECALASPPSSVLCNGIDTLRPFRPGRSAHQTLQTLHRACMSQRLRWVLDIDIEKYFDSIPHSQLRDFLDQRVTDGVIRRMIDKWLKAGALEDGLLRHATEEARRLLRRFHYMPKHASWLNMVEIEIGVLRTQCLDRRIASRQRLVSEIAAWERQRNVTGA